MKRLSLNTLASSVRLREGLGTMWGEQKARELLAEAGFERVDVCEIEGDIQNLYDLARPA